MKSIKALFMMSIRQALPLRRTIMLSLIHIAPVGIFMLSTSNRSEEAAMDALVGVAATILFALTVPVVSIVLGSSALGVERRDQTLSFIALRPIRRTAIAATKIAAATLAATAINMVGALSLGLAFTIRFGDPIVVWGLVVGVAAATSIYVSVSVPLGFLTDRAVVIAMAYLFVFENGAAILLSGLATLSPWRLGFAAFVSVVDATGATARDILGSLDISWSRTALIAIIVFSLATILTAQLLSHRDLA